MKLTSTILLGALSASCGSAPLVKEPPHAPTLADCTATMKIRADFGEALQENIQGYTAECTADPKGEKCLTQSVLLLITNGAYNKQKKHEAEVCAPFAAAMGLTAITVQDTKEKVLNTVR